MAPATYLGLPNNVWILTFGEFMAGASQGFGILPFIPEMIEIVV